ncbi:helix-turn-helix transcriptional regulator [Microbulbifer elongatus]|uniref:Helix-turn-helix transcriptional regulator n=1 Tax=Microbulbifer elongatus TaxID=86173 RepID=A0ABT1P495_9GAMM|nr:AraC family transcriptional regulator [Microbulbifer elongatus]MCQ3830919.1 helix-turn-helix transcriptional regulator [Microbulbifer elongatus]
MDILLFNVHDIVLMMTSYQCLLFALLLTAVRSEQKFSFLLLAAFLVTQAMIPMDTLISYGAGVRQWAIDTSPNLFYVFGFAYWLEGPVLLWYTRSLIYKDYRLARSDLVYLLPFLGYALYEYFTYFRFDSATKIAMLEGYTPYGETLVNLIIGFGRESLRLLFGVFCLIEIRNCRRQMRDTYSNVERIDFKWLLILVWGFVLLRGWAVLVNVALTLAAQTDVPVDFRIMGLASNYTVFILISAMIFFSLSYASMFEGIDRKQDGGEAPVPDDPAGEVAEEVKPAVDTALADRIARFMETEKPYLEPSLTLEQLAGKLDVPKRSVSNTINRHFERNFFEFVNQYRIEEAKTKLSDPDCVDLTVMDILLDSGFNTKATFNAFFKKLVGMTPTEYRKNALRGQSLPEKTASVQ